MTRAWPLPPADLPVTGLAARTRLLLGSVVDRPCAGCRGPGGPWCSSCDETLRGPASQADLRPRLPGLPGVWSVAAFEGPVREALIAFKDHGRWSLRSVLGAALAPAVAAAALGRPDAGLPERLTLVPVPGSPGSARARDGDHVLELARVAARMVRRTGLAADVVPALSSVRRRHDQVGLGRAARAANLSQAMTPSRVALGLTGVVLIDDLVTTGSTLAEASRALRSVGVLPLGAAVVAAAVSRR